jgi:hypothetical protein
MEARMQHIAMMEAEKRLDLRMMKAVKYTPSTSKNVPRFV